MPAPFLSTRFAPVWVMVTPVPPSRVNDLVMWDNTSVMHRRNDFDHAEPRFHKRTGFYLPDELAVPA